MRSSAARSAARFVAVDSPSYACQSPTTDDGCPALNAAIKAGVVQTGPHFDHDIGEARRAGVSLLESFAELRLDAAGHSPM